MFFQVGTGDPPKIIVVKKGHLEGKTKGHHIASGGYEKQRSQLVVRLEKEWRITIYTNRRSEVRRDSQQILLLLAIYTVENFIINRNVPIEWSELGIPGGFL